MGNVIQTEGTANEFPKTVQTKSRVKSGNIPYHSAQIILSSSLLYEYINIKTYRTIILSVVCETWSLTLREERRLRVFEKRVLRRVIGPKMDEVTREWRKLHEEQLNDVYSLPNIIRVIK